MKIGQYITIPNFIYLIFSFILSISGLFVLFPFYAFIALALLSPSRLCKAHLSCRQSRVSIRMTTPKANDISTVSS